MDTKALRQKILDLAIRGKLVPQDPNDEPASVLLERIRAEKERLISEGKIKRPKKSKASSSESHYQKLPDGWVETSLGELFEIGSAKRVMKSDWCSSGIPFYRTREIVKLAENGTVDNDLFISAELYSEMRTKYDVPQKGDIMLTAVGTIGIPYVVTESDLFYYKDASVLCFSNQYNLNPEFFKYLFLSTPLRKQMLSASKGTTVDTITIEKASAYNILLPPLAEQGRIAREIKSILSIIENSEKNIIQIKSLVKIAKSKILELAMHGKLVPQDPADEPAADMLRRINPKARIITDNPHYPQLPDNWVLTTIESVSNYGKCISVSVEDIKDDEWILELEDIEKDSGRVIEKKKKSCRNINGVRHKFNEGEVLYSKLRTYLNKVLLAKEVGYCTTEIIPISCNDSILPQYLCHWLRSPYFLNYTLSCGYGVKMPRLSCSDARNGIVPLPPLEEQKRIVQTIHKITKYMEDVFISLDCPK